MIEIVFINAFVELIGVQITVQPTRINEKSLQQLTSELDPSTDGYV